MASIGLMHILISIIYCAGGAPARRAGAERGMLVHWSVSLLACWGEGKKLGPRLSPLCPGDLVVNWIGTGECRMQNEELRMDRTGGVKMTKAEAAMTNE
jgi:hypothetical protein